MSNPGPSAPGHNSAPSPGAPPPVNRYGNTVSQSRINLLFGPIARLLGIDGNTTTNRSLTSPEQLRALDAIARLMTGYRERIGDVVDINDHRSRLDTQWMDHHQENTNAPSAQRVHMLRDRVVALAMKSLSEQKFVDFVRPWKEETVNVQVPNGPAVTVASRQLLRMQATPGPRGARRTFAELTREELTRELQNATFAPGTLTLDPPNPALYDPGTHRITDRAFARQLADQLFREFDRAPDLALSPIALPPQTFVPPQRETAFGGLVSGTKPKRLFLALSYVRDNPALLDRLQKSSATHATQERNVVATLERLDGYDPIKIPENLEVHVGGAVVDDIALSDIDPRLAQIAGGGGVTGELQDAIHERDSHRPPAGTPPPEEYNEAAAQVKRLRQEQAFLANARTKMQLRRDAINLLLPTLVAPLALRPNAVPALRNVITGAAVDPAKLMTSTDCKKIAAALRKAGKLKASVDEYDNVDTLKGDEAVEKIIDEAAKDRESLVPGSVERVKKMMQAVLSESPDAHEHLEDAGDDPETYGDFSVAEKQFVKDRPLENRVRDYVAPVVGLGAVGAAGWEIGSDLIGSAYDNPYSLIRTVGAPAVGVGLGWGAGELFSRWYCAKNTSPRTRAYVQKWAPPVGAALGLTGGVAASSALAATSELGMSVLSQSLLLAAPLAAGGILGGGGYLASRLIMQRRNGGRALTPAQEQLAKRIGVGVGIGGTALTAVIGGLSYAASAGPLLLTAAGAGLGRLAGWGAGKGIGYIARKLFGANEMRVRKIEEGSKKVGMYAGGGLGLLQAGLSPFSWPFILTAVGGGIYRKLVPGRNAAQEYRENVYKTLDLTPNSTVEDNEKYPYDRLEKAYLQLKFLIKKYVPPAASGDASPVDKLIPDDAMMELMDRMRKRLIKEKVEELSEQTHPESEQARIELQESVAAGLDEAYRTFNGEGVNLLATDSYAPIGKEVDATHRRKEHPEEKKRWKAWAYAKDKGSRLKAWLNT